MYLYLRFIYYIKYIKIKKSYKLSKIRIKIVTKPNFQYEKKGKKRISYSLLKFFFFLSKWKTSQEILDLDYYLYYNRETKRIKKKKNFLDLLFFFLCNTHLPVSFVIILKLSLRISIHISTIFFLKLKTLKS